MKLGHFRGAVVLGSVIFLTSGVISAQATGTVKSILPSAGVELATSAGQVSLSDVVSDSDKKITQTASESAAKKPERLPEPAVPERNESAAAQEETLAADPGKETPSGTRQTETQAGSEHLQGAGTQSDAVMQRDGEAERFRNLVIARVDGYVRVREDATTDAEIVGKLYDKSVGTFIEEKDGWYKIRSGSVTGYVKAEYCVTGEEAVTLAPQVGIRMATVNVDTLKVREEANTDSECLDLLPRGEQLVVKEELTDWLRVETADGDGYVFAEYITLSTEFVRAESKEEEEARLEKEREEREQALAAAQEAAEREEAEAEAAEAAERAAQEVAEREEAEAAAAEAAERAAQETAEQVSAGTGADADASQEAAAEQATWEAAERAAREAAEAEAAARAAQEAAEAEAATRAAQEAAEREAAERAAQQAAVAAAAAVIPEAQTVEAEEPSHTSPSMGEDLGVSVAQFAKQFVGNPYVYGGTSLTKGADCSGFVLAVYKNYGVSLPHSARADRNVGYAVEGGIANARPGDIVCYSGHVGIYIGGGQIVHASTPRGGIKISSATYSTPLAVRRIF